MDDSFKRAPVSTNEAAKISGYTASHIARLVRSGEIQGHKEGRIWLVSRHSLERFLETTERGGADQLHSSAPGYVRRNLAFVRSESRERVNEPPFSTAFRSDTGIAESPLGEYFVAFSIALAILASGAFVSQSLFLNHLSDGAVSLVGEVSYGFSSAFGTVSNALTDRMDKARAHLALVRTDNYSDTVPLPAYWSQFQAVPQAMGIPVPVAQQGTTILHAYDASDASIIAAEEAVGAHSFTRVRHFALQALAFVEAPKNSGSLLANGYLGMGELGYHLARGTLFGYLGLIHRAGGSALVLASSVLVNTERLPSAAYGATLFVGNTTIHSTHALLRAESMLAYEPALLAPRYARASFVVVDGLGGALLAFTTRAPSTVEYAFSEAVRAPAHIAPALSQSIFAAEYRLTVGFVDASRLVSGKYLAVVVGTGNMAYTVTSAAYSLPARVEQGFHSTAIALAHSYQLEKNNVLTPELLAQSFPGTANVSFTAAAVLARVFGSK